ncbi:MAG: hypothetical protein KDC44_14330 [Phaeodactylibacter sp.]|nr:hypothetical protein [Phaeodactylibacter sp.]
MKRMLLCWFAISLAVTNSWGFDTKPASVFDLMYQADILKLRLEGDLSKLILNPETEEYEPMLLDFEGEDGKLHSFTVNVRPRGKFRRQACDFPPLRLKFKKDDLTARNLEPEFNKLKLVTHCLDDRLLSRDNVMKEYLAYRMYQLISPYSFRVQLVEVTYVDTGLGVDGSTYKRFGIIIETDEQVAQRMHAERCDNCIGKKPEHMDARELVRLQLFQYMIGNADWNLSMERNIKLMQPVGREDWIGVPYDFDFSGLVDAPYALPNPDYDLQSVQERAYIGGKPDAELLKSVFEEFTAQRKAFRKSIRSTPKLSGAVKEEILSYLDTFYERDFPQLLELVKAGTGKASTFERYYFVVPAK